MKSCGHAVFRDMSFLLTLNWSTLLQTMIFLTENKKTENVTTMTDISLNNTYIYESAYDKKSNKPVYSSTDLQNVVHYLGQVWNFGKNQSILHKKLNFWQWWGLKLGFDVQLFVTILTT